jgi:hypothetical protein
VEGKREKKEDELGIDEGPGGGVADAGVALEEEHPGDDEGVVSLRS